VTKGIFRVKGKKELNLLPDYPLLKRRRWARPWPPRHPFSLQSSVIVTAYKA
jgi:hypothetical protein